ncbi:12S rRNA N(4)-cytidine methyltransferase METTL15 isoform X3 [Brachyhypopomus gauderio]|uniref:12S rRNA N(4)-cytidine methyltransferase METTL15 isoform X3 n=1 Tax=Brachyhypopomus gauderio TaxID=698409 RepID=UPI004041C717
MILVLLFQMALPGRALLVPLCQGSWGMWRDTPAHHWRNLRQPVCLCSGSARSSRDLERELHTPVLRSEVLHYLDIQPGQVFLDLTFGGGGHSKAILRSVPGVTLIAADRDPVAFRLAQKLAEEYPYPAMPCAADVVNALDGQALASVLAVYGEERHARRIAAAIVQARGVHPIGRTRQLARIVAGAFPSCDEYARRDRLQRPAHVATKTFQALRVFVNDELNELVAGLRAAQSLLRQGGRLCVLTFHSLEDRIVKRFLRGEDLSAPPRRSIRQHARLGATHEDEEDEEGGAEMGGDGGHWVPIQKKVVLPSTEEVQENPRGRSAKLRVATKR